MKVKEILVAIRDKCNFTQCEECPFYKGEDTTTGGYLCAFDGTPAQWELDEVPDEVKLDHSVKLLSENNEEIF